MSTQSDDFDWLLSRLHPFAKDVGSVVPDGFPAYARIFHPLWNSAGGQARPVRWRDIARANQRSLGAEVRALRLSEDPPRYSRSGEELWSEGARQGSMPIEVAERLAAILANHTRSPDRCWFAIWEGWADLRLPHGGSPLLKVPNRHMYVVTGSIEAVATSFALPEWLYQSPNLWWPDDRAWCVATEIEFRWTYVAGSAECIREVLNDAALEAIPTDPSEPNLMQA